MVKVTGDEGVGVCVRSEIGYDHGGITGGKTGIFKINENILIGKSENS